MTATDLISNPTFLALVERWKADGRAPIAGADWLRERGLDGQADAWQWAEGRDPSTGMEDDRNHSRFCCPRCWDSFAWWFFPEHDYFSGNTLPPDMAPADLPVHRVKDCPSFPAAIAWFLDRWAEVYGDAPAALQEAT